MRMRFLSSPESVSALPVPPHPRTTSPHCSNRANGRRHFPPERTCDKNYRSLSKNYKMAVIPLEWSSSGVKHTHILN